MMEGLTQRKQDNGAKTQFILRGFSQTVGIRSTLLRASAMDGELTTRFKWIWQGSVAKLAGGV